MKAEEYLPRYCTGCGALLEEVRDDKVQWYTGVEGKPVYRLDFVCPNWRWWQFYTHKRTRGFLYPDDEWKQIIVD